MADFKKGDILDARYEILGVLGSGGMGRVYRARQLNLNRIVAIKVPSDKMMSSSAFRARFVQEALTCAQISHANVVAIYDVHAGSRPYIVMECAEGLPLNRYVKEEATTIFVSDLLEVIGQICQGLDAAHDQGIVHRDIKPGNILISSDSQQVKIMDFGIARVIDRASVTHEGSMLGTPYYMSPEQIQGKDVTTAADLYSLGCIVYRLLTGKHMFEGELATILFKHVSSSPAAPTLRNPMLPASVDQAVARLLDKIPTNRPKSAMEFHRELRKALRPLAHLPYSQMFPGADGPFVPHNSPVAAQISGSNALPVAAYGPTIALSDIVAEANTSLNETGNIEFDDVEKTGEWSLVKMAKRKPGWIKWGALVLVALACCVAGIVQMMSSGNDDDSSLANDSGVPNGTSAKKITLKYLGSVPNVVYDRGDWVLLRWVSEPSPAANKPYAYQVRLSRKGQKEPVLMRKTQMESLAWKAQRPGEYELSIERPGSAESILRTKFKVKAP